MSPSIKINTPALIMALTVFPGAGHFYLKKKIRGAFWAVLTFILLGILIYIFEKELFRQAMQSQVSLFEFKNLLFKVWLAQKTNFISLLLGTFALWMGSFFDLLFFTQLSGHPDDNKSVKNKS